MVEIENFSNFWDRNKKFWTKFEKRFSSEYFLRSEFQGFRRITWDLIEVLRFQFEKIWIKIDFISGIGIHFILA